MAFQSYSAMHAAVLVGVAASIGLLVAAGRAWHGSTRQRWLERGVATAILLLRAGVFLWNLLQPHRDLGGILPLQICDLAAICSALALLSERRWLAVIAYFWGLALSVQGLIQPDLRAGPESLEFWLFWLHHTLIVGVAIYLTLVRGFRPNRRDFVFAALTGWAYVALVFCVDLGLDVNYGYLGRANPAYPTLLDWLGPWPWRVLAMTALGTLLMWLLLLPWSLFGGRRSSYS